MKRDLDIAVHLDGLFLVHQNMPGKKTRSLKFKEHILFVPLQGEISLHLENAVFKLGQGRMLYLPPNTSHSFASSQHQGERLIALIDPRHWSEKIHANHPSIITPSVLPSHALIRELLFYVLVNMKSPSVNSCVQTLIEVLGEQLRTTATRLNRHQIEHLESKVRDFRVMAALEYMKVHLADDLSMADVAKKSGLSLRSLNRLVLNETGLSPRNMLIRYRISHAQDLLIEKKDTVTQVALDVGYQSLSHFITAFKNITGRLPSEWVSNQR